MHDVMREDGPLAMQIARRYLQASFEYVTDANGDLILLHPGLADPYRLVGGERADEMCIRDSIPVFARKIYNESRRLLKLIEDIMHLSKLDEGFAAGCLRRVDLLEAARTAVEENAEATGDRNVTVRLTGESVFINADPTLLDEMLRNVCLLYTSRCV